MDEDLRGLEKALQNQIDTIENAITRARQNELVDIGDMDGHVTAICQKIMHAENEEIRQLEPKMIEMIAKLDELAVELKDYQDRVDSAE